jgi:group I intron endonuclease
MIGIYKITSPSGKVYIGQSWDIEKRFNKDYKNATLCKNQRKLFLSFTKHGTNNHKFETIECVTETITQKQLDDLEQSYMNAYKEHGFELLNIREAGSRGKHSEETIKKMKGLSPKWLTGRKVSIETRNKMSASAIGKKKPLRSEQHRINLSLSNMGHTRNKLIRVKQYSIIGIFIKEWESIKSASENLKLNSSNIGLVCKGLRKTTGGYIWKY